MRILVQSVEAFGRKIVLASSRERVDKEHRAPTYAELYSNPEKYKNRLLV